jgi:hypothetical protein
LTGAAAITNRLTISAACPSFGRTTFARANIVTGTATPW